MNVKTTHVLYTLVGVSIVLTAGQNPCSNNFNKFVTFLVCLRLARNFEVTKF